MAGRLGSNRTFMELKFKLRGKQEGEIFGSNRTFMELKSHLLRHTFASRAF